MAGEPDDARTVASNVGAVHNVQIESALLTGVVHRNNAKFLASEESQKWW